MRLSAQARAKNRNIIAQRNDIVRNSKNSEDIMWLTILFFSLILAVFAVPFFPVLASVLFRSKTSHNHVRELPKSIDILIPCHNEQGRLRATLDSIVSARETATALFPEIEINIFIGLDSCEDDTKKDVGEISASTFEFQHRSKWRVLADLLEHSKADWIACVDAGTAWDKRLVRNILPYLAMEETSCFAPGYRMVNSGYVGRAFWSIEAFLKTIENSAGGPISVHGATVFYRRTHLQKIFRALAGRSWINDDVAIPLTLRTLYPFQQIHYAGNSNGGFVVTDTAPRIEGGKCNARERIAHGNLQWITHLLPLTQKIASSVLVVAMRRIFRLLWCAPVTLFLIALLGFAIEQATQEKELWISVATASIAMSMAIKLIRSPAYRASLAALWSILSRQKKSEVEPRWS
jgi:hypothetical protein